MKNLFAAIAILSLSVPAFAAGRISPEVRAEIKAAVHEKTGQEPTRIKMNGPDSYTAFGKVMEPGPFKPGQKTTGIGAIADVKLSDVKVTSVEPIDRGVMPLTKEGPQGGVVAQ
jgi:hypothetical protein